MNTAGINLRGLDSLRGLLAVYVIVGHGRGLLWSGPTNWLASQPRENGWAFNRIACTLRISRSLF